MTSPSKNPAAFHARPIGDLVALPPHRHLIYRCNLCGRSFVRWRNLCTCHGSAILHGVEVDSQEYARLRAANE